MADIVKPAVAMAEDKIVPREKVLINSSSWWLYGRLVIKTPLTKVVNVLSREQQMGQPNLLAAKDMSAVGLRKQNNRKTMEMK